MNHRSRLRRYLFGVSAHAYSRAMTVALLLPLLVLLLGAFIFPILRFLALGVFDPMPTLAHFQTVIDRPFFATVLTRTFRTAGVVMVGTLILGYPVAYLMASLRRARATIVAAIVVLPLWISVLVRTYVWAIFLGRQGVINQVALATGLIEQPMQLLNTEFAVWVAMIHILLPMMILPIYSSLRGIPPELAMAAESLGASPLAVLRAIIIPLSLPGVGAGAVLVFIISLGYFITPMLLGGPRSMLIGNLITEQATRFLDWPLTSALSTVLMLATLIVVLVFNRLLRLDRVLGAG
jgi:mannopine transport system permease protein